MLKPALLILLKWASKGFGVLKKMSKSSETQTSSVTTLKLHEKDTGSSEVQIELLTQRIEALTGHFKTHAKDFLGRRGLLSLVGKRRSLLAYLKRTNKPSYESVLAKLDLRH